MGNVSQEVLPPHWFRCNVLDMGFAAGVWDLHSIGFLWKCVLQNVFRVAFQC